MELLAQARLTFFGMTPNSPELWVKIIVTFILGLGVMFAFTKAPIRARRMIVFSFTFASGLFYILLWLWPVAVAREPGTLPNNAVEGVAFWLDDAVPRIADVAQILTAFLLGLGIMSLLTVHTQRIRRKAQDWKYSVLLMVSLVTMVGFGYVDWIQKKFQDPQGKLLEMANWGPVQYGQDLLFDGAYQQMEAAMFSMIAFFILSAAYRAFRVRSVESTVLMASALILMLSLMGALDFIWTTGINNLVAQTHNPFLDNFKISEVAGWVKSTLQTPSIRAIEFGVGLGAVAMGLRIWLGLERGGVSA
ncbi:MAG: hypothetical protein JSS65_12560 [Armatimonadetes bacterium]|nr:hypothetical protein [Armatimonadota bacterium]